jgi:hypothetical protein
MKNDLRYAKATGMLQTMCRYLVKDLEKAIRIIDDNDNWEIKSMQISVDHGNEVLNEVTTMFGDATLEPPSDEPEEGEGEQSLDEIGRAENAYIDGQEAR